jgi:hypothetical protein
MTFLNGLLARIFELLLWPLKPLPIVWSIATVSLATAVAILFVMRATSDPNALAAARRQLYADLLEIRLFKDDFRSMLRAQLSLCRHNASYFGLVFASALWTIPQCYFTYTGATVNYPVLVAATLKSPDVVPDIALDPPPGIRLETGAIWFPALREVAWRVVPDSTGDYILRVHAGGIIYEKTLKVSPRLGRRSVQRPTTRLIDQLRYPSETPLPDSAPLTSIRVDYPDLRINLLGADLSGMEVYYVLSLVFALVLRRPLM